jgi:hypothetical protein
MAGLKVLEPQKWASSEQVIQILDDLLKEAKNGEIVSIAYVAERRDDYWASGSTKTNNAFAMAGYMISMGMRVMGFEDTRARKKL